MATIDVSKVGNPIAALKKLKRTLERQGGGGAPKFSDRHIKPSEKRRRDKLAAIKREKKKQVNQAKNLLMTTRRYRHFTLKQIMVKISGG
jgi:ribosomal protein S21